MTRLPGSALLSHALAPSTYTKTPVQRDSHLAEARAVGSYHKCLPWTLNILKKLGNLTPAVMLALENQSQVPTLCTSSGVCC